MGESTTEPATETNGTRPLAPILDGAAAGLQAALEDLRGRFGEAADPALPGPERLEIYEDLIDSEVGDSPLTRARNLERESGLRQLWVKFDGGNPTGTQKDRIAFAQVHDAMRRGFDTLTVASCGNYGAALALAASLAGLRCRVFIPAVYQSRRTEEIERLGAEVVRSPGGYEEAVAASRASAGRQGHYDANPGGANTALQLQAYGEIASEIYDELRDAPAVVAVPVSNGTTLAGIYKGFVRLHRRGKTSRVPRIVGGSSSRKNPIVRSFQLGLEHCEDLDPGKLRETPVNEPLINWHSYDGEHALDAIRASDGWADDASDRTMLRQARQLLLKEGLNALPASCVGLAVLLAGHAKAPLPADRYVAVLTGRR